MKIDLESAPDKEKLKQMGIENWPIWEEVVSEFPWKYDSTETCYILEGEVTVTPEGGVPVTIKKGDLVTFPKGMACTWKITKNIKKHYDFK